MKILSLDSSGAGCSVCLFQDGRELALLEEKMERGQDSRLVPMVQEVMAKAGLTFQMLDRIAVTRGPGSFTGLRIGLATARGLGLAAEKPVIGIDRFSLFKAQRGEKNESLLVVLESRRLELYTCFFPSYGKAEEPRMLTPDEIGSMTRTHSEIKIVGDAAESLRGAVDTNRFDAIVEAEVVTCAKMAVSVALDDQAYLPRPLYVRPPDVTIKADDA